MNSNCYRIIFSKRLGGLVAVGEHAVGQGKSPGAGGRFGFGRRVVPFFVAPLCLSFAAVSMAWGQTAANALPSGGAVSAGAASISSNGAGMTIQQSTDRAAINWQSFSIGKDASVNVVQPGTQSVLLNRVVGESPSQIFGRLSANGQIVLVNPNGIAFGRDGSVSAGGFVASTLNISDKDLMDGNMRFERKGSTAGVVNQGTIQTQGGYVALLGASVSNDGRIETQGGAALLGSAETVQIPVGRTGRIQLELTPAQINASIANTADGVIVTEGGQVYIRAAALNHAMASIVHSGSIDTTASQGGAVHVLADGGQIQVDGRITANSTGQNDQGQTRAGGDIVIGRDLETGAMAKAADFGGARLESQGGFVETSGDWLQLDGIQIQARDWLIDPNDIVIDNSNPTSGTSIANAQTLNGTSYINATDLTNALATANVTVATSASATGGNGDIFVNANVGSFGPTTRLTLQAQRDIQVNNAQLSNGTQSLTLTAGQDIRFNAGSSIYQNLGAQNSTVLTATRDIVFDAPISTNGYFNATATRDIVLNQNVASDGLGTNFTATRDILINAPQTNAGAYTYRATQDIFVNHSITSTAALTLKAGNGSAWSANGFTGAVHVAPTAVLTGDTSLSVESGRSNPADTNTPGPSSASSNNTNRTSLMAANIGWTTTAGATDTPATARSVVLRGFDQVVLGNTANPADPILANSLEIWARDIRLSSSLSSQNTQLIAAPYNNANGNYLEPYNLGPVFGWASQQGQVVLDANKSIAYTNNLIVQSGKAADNSRSSLPAGSIVWAQNPSALGQVNIDGFDTVAINSDVSSARFGITARQIDVDANITTSNALRLFAGSFNTDGTNNLVGDAIADNVTTQSIFTKGVSTGWERLPGTVDLDPNKTLRATRFDLRSGTVLGSPLVRPDFDAGQLQPYAVGGTDQPVTGLYLAGFRDVNLNTGFTSISNPSTNVGGEYTVIAQSIDATPLANQTLNAYSLNLQAGQFRDSAGVNSRAYSADNTGVLTLPDTTAIQASRVDLQSGRTVSGASSVRTDFKPAAFSPYVNPDNPTQYTGNLSSNGLLSGARTGGARQLLAQGFGTIDLPDSAYPLNYENVTLRANTIVIDGSINTGQYNNNALGLYAGSYNPGSGASSGVGAYAGKIEFNNNPVLRSQGYVLTSSTDNSTKPLGAGSTINVVNGTDAADFTAQIGYSQPDYSAGGAGVINGLEIRNFNNTTVALEAQGAQTAPPLLIQNTANTATLNLVNRSDASAPGAMVIHNDVVAQASATLNADRGGIRMGEQVLRTGALSVSASLNSAVNTDADSLTLTSRGAGQTTVVNEANNISLNAGSSADAGNIELNARGQITLTANLTRTAAGSSATLRADARYGRTIDKTDSTQTLLEGTDLNTTFANHGRGLAGESGGDGLGSVAISSAQPTLLIPTFRRLAVVDGSSFTVNAANTYFQPNGTAYANNTVLTQGTPVYLNATTALPAGLDAVTASGDPYRLKAEVDVGGWTVPTANTYFDANGIAFAANTNLTTGTVVYYKTSTTLPAGNIRGTGDNGQQPLFAISSYTTTTSASAIPVYTSLGLSRAATYTPLSGFSQNANSLAVDTALVDTSQPGNYFGNPVSGTANALNMSGQFYTVDPSNNWVGYNFQGSPTMLNGLANGRSASGNGWDITWRTAELSTNGGNLSLFSGPRHALGGSGYEVGDWADLSLFSNPNVSDLSKNKLVYEGATKVTSGTGNLVVMGYRDVQVKDPGNLVSSGHVTIGAARDLRLEANTPFTSADPLNPKLVTLIAGGTVTNQSGGDFVLGQTDTSQPGSSNLMVVAGGGVDLKTNMAAVAGSLQDNPTMVDAFANGITPSGIFNAQSANPNGLLVGGPFTNGQVKDVSFDGSTGIVYAANTPLSRTGISSSATASQLSSGSAGAGYGAVNLTTLTGSVTIDQAIDTTSTGGNITITSPTDVLQNADILAGTGDVTLTATTGGISRTAGTVGGNDVLMSAATTIGSSTERISTAADTLRLNSAGDQYISEADSVTLASRTTNNGVLVVTGTGTGANDTLTIGTASGLSGVDTGSGEINVRAAQNVALAADVTTTGNAFIEATAGAISRSAGTLSATDAVLTAGTTIGASGSPVQTAANQLGITAGGDVHVSDAGDLTVSGQSTGGALNVQVPGNLVVNSLNLQPTVGGNAAGYNSSGLSADTLLSLTAGGSITQADANQLLSATDTVLSAGTTIGTNAQNMLTQTGTLRMDSAGDQFITEANDVTLAASTSSGGSVNVQTTSGSITLDTASGANGVSANGAGQVVLTANGTGSDIAVNQAITSDSGEINLKSADSVALAANFSTDGNAFIQATGGSITRTAGTVSASAAVLTAGTSIGASGSEIQTSVNQLGITTGQNAYVADADSVTVSAQSSAAGTVNVSASTGTLTVQNLSISPTVASHAAGYSLAGSAGVSAAGNVVLAANNAGAAQGVVVDDSITAAGQVTVTATSTGQTAIQVADNISAGDDLTLTGATSDGANAIALASGVQLVNTGGITRLEATQGNISAPASLSSRASITQSAGAGAVQIVAGNTASSAGAIDASQLDITQNGADGVLMQTTGTGNLTVAKVDNNGNGNVVLSAGSALAAGNGTGGQVQTVAGNAVTESGTGKTYVYTGNAADTGVLSTLDGGFATLYLSANAGGTRNATSNTAYASGPVANSGSNSQVMFREKVAVDTQDLSQAQLQVTYGDADPTNQSVINALQTANANTVLTTPSNAATLKLAAQEVINNDLTATLATPTRAYRDVDTYDYAITPSTTDYTTFNSAPLTAQATLQVVPKALTASLTGTVSKVYDGNTNATLASNNFVLTGFVSGEGARVSQTVVGTYASKNVDDNGGTGAVSAALLSTDLAANAGTVMSNYTLPTTASGNIGTITPAPLTIKVGSTKAFVTQDANTANDTGFSYSGLQGTESAADALVQVPTALDRTYNGSTNTPVVGSYSSVYGLGFTPTANNGNYAITVLEGDLQVIPADKLLITIASQTDTYGNRTASNAGQASSVIAQLCLDASNCNGANIYSLSMSAGSGNRWSGTDNTNTTVQFDTSVNTSGQLSGGGFLKAGNHSWGVDNLSSSASPPYNGYEVNSGTLAVDRLAITPTANAVSKVYDGTASAAGVKLDTAQAKTGDVLSAVAGSGSYATRNVITNDTVTFGNLSLQGADMDNYALTSNTVQGTGSITPKAITLSGITAADKVYDGNTTATVSTANAVFADKVAGDDLSVGSTGAFDTKNAANGKTVNLTNTLGGADLGNYTVTDQASATASITPKAITLSGITAADKIYDGNTTATLSTANAVFADKVAGDELSVSSTGVFADKNAASGKTVNLSNTLGGADRGNYTITDQASTTASITPKPVTAAAEQAQKTFNGQRQTQSLSEFSGVLAGDVVVVEGLASGIEPGTYTSNLRLTGADQANYVLDPAKVINAPLVIISKENQRLPEFPNIKPSDNSAPSKIDVSPIYGNSGGAVGGVNPFLGCTNTFEQNEAKEIEGQKPERDNVTSNCECTRPKNSDVDVCYKKVNITMNQESPSK